MVHQKYIFHSDDAYEVTFSDLTIKRIRHWPGQLPYPREVRFPDLPQPVKSKIVEVITSTNKSDATSKKETIPTGGA